MSLNDIVDRGLRGAFAGLLGGSVFGVWMAEKGVLGVSYEALRRASLASLLGRE